MVADPIDLTFDPVLKTPGRRKNNWTAVVPPDVTDDEDAGYEVGSRWVDTVEGLPYTCVDSSSGAAVWSAGGGGDGGGGLLGLDTDSVTRSAGNYTLNNTSWTNVDTGLDLVVDANDGDALLVALSSLWGAEAVNGFLDVATIVSGSPVNYVTGGGGASDEGVMAWYGSAATASGTLNLPIGGAIMYTVVSGDISGGTVTLRLRYRTVTGSKTLFGSSTHRLHFSVVNLRGGAPAPFKHVMLVGGGSLTTSSATMTAIDTTNLPYQTHTLEVGEVVRCTLCATIGSNTGTAGFDFEVDQPTSSNTFIAPAADYGVHSTRAVDRTGMTAIGLFVATEAGLHGFRPAWRTESGFQSKICNATSGVEDVPIIFTTEKLGMPAT